MLHEALYCCLGMNGGMEIGAQADNLANLMPSTRSSANTSPQIQRKRHGGGGSGGGGGGGTGGGSGSVGTALVTVNTWPCRCFPLAIVVYTRCQSHMCIISLSFASTVIG